MNNDLLARQDCEIAKLQEKIIAITKEKEELKKEIEEMKDMVKYFYFNFEMYQDLFKKIKSVKFKG